MGEDGGRYRRPIVHNVYHEPIDLFDRHLYEKGSLVLHMIRTVLGDDGVEEGDPPLRREAPQHQRHDARLPARDRGGDRPQHRLAVRPVRLPRRPPAVPLALRVGRGREAGEAQRQQTQDEKDSSIFRLPVTIDFTVDGKKHAFPVEITEKRAQLLLLAARRAADGALRSWAQLPQDGRFQARQGDAALSAQARRRRRRTHRRREASWRSSARRKRSTR